MATATLIEKVTEADPVRRWRFEQLEQGGYAPTDALLLSARSEVDIHLAVRILRQGCPVHTALRILL